jgi:hypothetical protein
MFKDESFEDGARDELLFGRELGHGFELQAQVVIGSAFTYRRDLSSKYGKKL